ncbi:MAG: hypothetical protein ACR2PF_18335 [Rhizobiaceae bacterium]
MRRRGQFRDATVGGFWGLLYIYWAANGAISGHAFIVESVECASNPALFWIINAMWAAAGLWVIATSLPGSLI